MLTKRETLAAQIMAMLTPDYQVGETNGTIELRAKRAALYADILSAELERSSSL